MVGRRCRAAFGGTCPCCYHLPVALPSRAYRLAPRAWPFPAPRSINWLRRKPPCVLEIVFRLHYSLDFVAAG